MKNISLTFLIAFMSFSSAIYGQTGVLEGNVYRMVEGQKEVMYMTIAELKGGSLQPICKTDYDGNYSVELSAGEHLIVFRNSAMQMRTDTVPVTIEAGSTKHFDYEMTPDGVLETIVISAERLIDGGGSENKMVAETKESEVVGSNITVEVAENKGAGDTGDMAEKMT